MIPCSVCEEKEMEIEVVVTDSNSNVLDHEGYCRECYPFREELPVGKDYAI